MSLPKQQLRMLEIGSDIADGKIADPMCPYCGTPNLVFSFTIISPPMYGLFLVCKNCQHAQHFTFKDKPKGFQEDLVLEEYQRLEDEAVRGADESKPGGNT